MSRKDFCRTFTNLEDAEICVNCIADQWKRYIGRWLSSARRGERRVFKGAGLKGGGLAAGSDGTGGKAYSRRIM
ncbi:MAG: hypothetical protein CSB33_04115 [Desulfobacterales bacterium]|nr:MAG: hypothetical protein CSB33_04115 [Desulfobacterales bacterium]